MLGMPLAELPFHRMAITCEPSHFIRASDQLSSPPSYMISRSLIEPFRERTVLGSINFAVNRGVIHRKLCGE